MADYRWASTSGALGSATSYSPTSGPPGLDDSIYFDSLSQTDVTTGLADFTGVDKTTILVTEDYHGDIGASGNPLTLPVKRLIHNGSGSLFYAFEQHADRTTILVDSPNQQDAFHLASGGHSTLRLMCVDGGVRIASGAGPLRYLLVGSRNSKNLPFVTIGSSLGGDVTSYRQYSGVVTTSFDLGTAAGAGAIIDGGVLTYAADGTTTWDLLDINSGGTVFYNGTGTLSTCIVGPGGTLDMSRDRRAKTISSLKLMPGSIFKTHQNITVSSLYDFREKIPTIP